MPDYLLNYTERGETLHVAGRFVCTIGAVNLVHGLVGGSADPRTSVIFNHPIRSVWLDGDGDLWVMAFDRWENTGLSVKQAKVDMKDKQLIWPPQEPEAPGSHLIGILRRTLRR